MTMRSALPLATNGMQELLYESLHANYMDITC